MHLICLSWKRDRFAPDVRRFSCCSAQLKSTGFRNGKLPSKLKKNLVLLSSAVKARVLFLDLSMKQTFQHDCNKKNSSSYVSFILRIPDHNVWSEHVAKEVEHFYIAQTLLSFFPSILVCLFTDEVCWVVFYPWSPWITRTPFKINHLYFFTAGFPTRTEIKASAVRSGFSVSFAKDTRLIVALLGFAHVAAIFSKVLSLSDSQLLVMVMLMSMKQDFKSAAKETPFCWFHVV